MTGLETKVRLWALLLGRVLHSIAGWLTRRRGSTGRNNWTIISQCLAVFAPMLVYLLAAGCGGGGLAPIGPTSTGTSTSTSPPPAAQKIYIADTFNDRIVRIDDMTGAGWTVFNGAINGITMDDPSQIWLDAQSRIYVADWQRNRIIRIDDMTGANPQWYAPVGPQALDRPKGVAVASDGKVFIADSVNNQIVRIDDLGGGGRTTYGGPGGSPLNGPTGLWLDSAGTTLYVADYNNNRIGAITNIAANGNDWVWSAQYTEANLSPYSIYVQSSTSKIYIGTDLWKGKMIRIDNMAGLNRVEYGGGAPKAFISPLGVALDANGRIYAMDSNRSYLARFDDMVGTNWITYGSSGATQGKFSLPTFIFIK